MTISASKKTNSIFRPLLSENFPHTIIAKMNQLKKLIEQFVFHFPKFSFYDHSPFFSLNFHPFWPCKFFWNISLVKAYTSRRKMAQFSLMVSKVKPNHPSWQGWSPLSGDNIWIKVLPQKRYTVHIDGCDIWNDLRPFLNFLVHPFSSKLRSKEAKGLKSGNLGKWKKFKTFV